MSSAAARVAAAITWRRAPRSRRPVAASSAAARATARAAVLRVTWGTTMRASADGLVAFGWRNRHVFEGAHVFEVQKSGAGASRKHEHGS